MFKAIVCKPVVVTPRRRGCPFFGEDDGVALLLHTLCVCGVVLYADDWSDIRSLAWKAWWEGFARIAPPHSERADRPRDVMASRQAEIEVNIAVAHDAAQRKM